MSTQRQRQSVQANIARLAGATWEASGKKAMAGGTSVALGSITPCS